MHCPVTKINLPRFLVMSVVGYAFLFGFEYLVHHILLMDLYTQTESLWRPMEAMEEFFPIMIVRNVLLVVLIGYIFTRNFEGKGIMEGIRFGLPVGVLLGLVMSSSYIWMSIPLELALGWASSGLGLGLGLGIVFSLIYKK
ncbi:MAG: hypothetical protein AAF204_05190 [Pseudomonadota bacterium]